MKFLLDVNVPRRLAQPLVAAGHEARHAADAGMGSWLDSVIVDAARHASEVIITHDLDYGNLLAFSGEAAPSVVIFRTRNTHPDYLARRLGEIVDRVLPDLEKGSIVVVEDAATRVRPLPIRDA